MPDSASTIPGAEEITDESTDQEKARESAKAQPARDFVNTVFAANLRKSPLLFGCLAGLNVLYFMSLYYNTESAGFWWVSALTLLVFLSAATFFVFRFSTPEESPVAGEEPPAGRTRKAGLLDQMTDAVCIAKGVFGLGVVGLMSSSFRAFALAYGICLVHAGLGLANTVWPQWSPRARRAPSPAIFLATCYVVYLSVILVTCAQAYTFEGCGVGFDPDAQGFGFNPLDSGQIVQPPVTPVNLPHPGEVAPEWEEGEERRLLAPGTLPSVALPAAGSCASRSG